MSMTEQEIRADERAKIAKDLEGWQPFLFTPAGAGVEFAVRYIRALKPVAVPEPKITIKWFDHPWDSHNWTVKPEKVATPTLVDKIASTVFESEYAMRWTQAISNSGMSAIVERHRRNARLSIEATGQFIDAMETLSDHDAQAVDWIAGFLRDAALVQAGDGIKEARRYPATT